MSEDTFEPLKDVADTMPRETVAPAHGIAAIALSMAMKYHDIQTIQDGTLYQQYKLEGKNIEALHLDMVFETAIRIEKHLLGSSDRIAAMLVEAIEIAVDDDAPQEDKGDTEGKSE
jgi:hypothetical protein